MTELFANFEVNHEPRWKIVLGLLAGSAALHLALAASVVFVPTLRDALNIAALAGRAGFVDKPYARTVFGENIQMVQAVPKFQYPPGYFAPASSQALAAASPTPDPNAPKILFQAKPLQPAGTPSPLPSPSPASSPSPVVAQAKGSSVGQPGSGKPVGDQKAGEQKADTADEAKQKEAQKKLDEIAAANHLELPTEDEINRKPLKDLVAQTNDLKNKGKLDLGQSFDIRIEADLDAQGRLINPTVTRKSGDATLVDLSTRAIGVLNETGLVATYLKFLSEGRPLKVTFAINQDQDHLNATIESEVNSEDGAQQKAKTLNGALLLGRVTRDGKDEAILMQSTVVSSEGKKVIVKFTMARQAVEDLLKKQLASASTTKQG